MEVVRTFLESSTIHGLTYISTTRKYSRLFWTLVVFMGFSYACYMILESFKSWDEMPVKTSVETLPISQLKFPRLTVCPPKNTYTDMNYDLMEADTMTLNKSELSKQADQIVDDCMFMNDLNKLQEENRYFNRYHGYTVLNIQKPDKENIYYRYELNTVATSGSISSQYYGEPFQQSLVVDMNEIVFEVNVIPPESVQEDDEVTLHFQLVRLPITGLSAGSQDSLRMYGIGYLDELQTSAKEQISPPKSSHEVVFTRHLTMEDLATVRMQNMPGFRLSWWYTGKEVQPESKFKDDPRNSRLAEYVYIFNYFLVKA